MCPDKTLAPFRLIIFLLFLEKSCIFFVEVTTTRELINNVVTNDDFLEVESDTESGHAVIISGREWQMLRELLKHSLGN